MTRDEMIKAFEIITKKCDKIVNSKDYVADDYTQNIVEDIGELCNKILDGKFGKISLPSNLDEAAEEYTKQLDEALAYVMFDESIRYWIFCSFKEGAKWMAEQGRL